MDGEANVSKMTECKNLRPCRGLKQVWAVLLLGALTLLGNVAGAVTISASPTTCTSVAGIGTVAWTNPARAISSNNSYATASVDGTTTRYLQCTGYNFVIPAGATINGITVNVTRRSSSIANGGSRDAAMRLLKAGVIGATDRSTATTYTAANVIQAHGSAADLWGTTWTPADINAANFGAAFAATKPNAAGAAQTVSVDYIQITIDYTPSALAYSVLGSPTTCTSVAGIGTVAWTNPANAISSNNLYATAAVDGTTTRYLQCTGYNFAIPAGATITGITVNVERRSSSAGNGGSRDAAMRLVKAGAIGATDRSTGTSYTTADVTEAHGGVADLWGTTWTPADINAANFGAAFAATKPNAAGAAQTVRVDYVRIRIDYTMPAVADHILITHTGSALTCSPKTLTISACANASCSTLYTGGGLSVTLTPGGQVFAIGVSGVNVAATVQQAVAGAATLTAVSAPATMGPTTCLNTSNASTACANAMVFNASGFIVTAPNHVACSNTAVTIEAVQQGVPANKCVPAYAGVTRPVSLSIAYANPLTGTRSATDVANGTLIGTAASAHNLAFDATGKATLLLSYPDVGRVTLTANDTAPTGAALTGNAQFIAAPAAFAFSAVTAGLIKAGNDFSATITAQTGSGAACAAALAAPNFGRESAPESVTLSPALVAPVGGNNPALANNVIAGAGFVNGAATVSNLSWGEVGLIALTGNLSSASYLGSGLAATGSSGNIGRFIPEHFDTVVQYNAATQTFMPCPTGLICPVSGDLVNGNGFVYSGQACSTRVTARNLGGGITQNYDAALAYSRAVMLTAWDAPGSVVTPNPGPGALTLNTVPASAFSLGVATTNSPVYTFATTPVAPADICMRASEAAGGDGVTSLRVAPAISAEGGVKVVNGRIKITNAYGSELLPLTLTATAQYYQSLAAGWVTSATDNVTLFNTALSPAGNLVATIIKGPLAAVSVVGPAPAAVSGGVRPITLAAPGLGNTGAADLSLTAPGYMLGGSNGAGVSPSVPGRATFGVYKGNNPYIYQREAY